MVSRSMVVRVLDEYFYVGTGNCFVQHIVGIDQRRGNVVELHIEELVVPEPVEGKTKPGIDPCLEIGTGVWRKKYRPSGSCVCLISA